MGELLQDWKHERLYEGVQPVDEAQGSGGHPKAVEAAKNHLQESAKAESLWKVQLLRRGYFSRWQIPGSDGTGGAE